MTNETADAITIANNGMSTICSSREVELLFSYIPFHDLVGTVLDDDGTRQ